MQLGITSIKWDKGAINNILSNFMEETTDILVIDAKDNCPVKTGALQDSITSVISYSKGDSINDIEVIVGSDLPYALAIELGTRHMQPQPYLRPALDNLGNRIKEE